MKNNIFLLTLLFLTFSCKKNQLGGDSTISGQVSHHEKVIAGARVFIKFNAKDFPGTDTNIYDSKVVADGLGNYSITCYKGDYYLYGYGTDLDVDSPFVVSGGVPAIVRRREDVNLKVAVTE